MPMSTLKLKPGVNVEGTPSLLEAGYFVSNLIRFRNGLAEKLGGWTRYYANAVGGIPKAMHAWLDLNDTEYLAVGSTTILGVISDDALSLLTPQIYTSDFVPGAGAQGFTTTISSANVTIVDPNISNPTTFTSIEFKTPVSVGGIILSGVYPIDLVLGTSQYRIVAADVATSGVTNGGAVPVFASTSGSQIVTVTLASHGLSVGDTINFPLETVLNIDGNDNFTKVLLHANGTDASTTFTDSNAGGSSHSWTATGNAQVDTADYWFGGASALFDGTGDYVTTPDSTDFTLGSGDFTVDFWIRCNAASGTIQRLCGQCDSTPTNASTSFRIYRTAANIIQADVCVGSTAYTVATTSTFTSASANWFHIALVRNGTSLAIYVNGAQQGTTTISGTVNNSTSVLAVGTTGAVTSNPWTGWIDEVRLSVGVARWTTTFTRPTGQYGAQAASVLGTYTATTVPSSSTFTINISSLAGATGNEPMNRTYAELLYYIALGPSAGGPGYGINTYGTGGYGVGSSSSAQTGTAITSTDWSLDNWGQTLLACAHGGAIYAWTPNTGFSTAQFVSGAPPHNTGAFVSMQTQMLICYGSTEEQTIGLDQDPLLVKWSAQGDYTDFIISTTSQAGSRRLSQGSKIVGALSVPNQELLWTDLDLWSMNYLGTLAAGVWGFTKIGANCGLIGKHAAVRQGGNVAWMGISNFFMLGSNGAQVIPCTVWDAVFQDLNRTYQSKCWAWSNTPFNEVWFFYPRASTEATEPDAYVKVNLLDGLWDYGPMDRTCGIDQSILGMPIAAASTGLVYEHETSLDADGQPITSYFQTGLYQLSEGQEINFVDWWLPDFKYQTFDAESTSAALQITIYSQYYLGDTPTTHGPYLVGSTTNYFNPRIRGRFLSFRVQSADLGSWWRWGASRVRLAPDGRF